MTDSLKQTMLKIGKDARACADILRLCPAEKRQKALNAMAYNINGYAAEILQENAKDLAAGRKKGLSDALLDRLELNVDRIKAISASLKQVATMDDPVGHVQERWTRPNGLTIEKVRTPIGVIGMVYESRPNVTADAAALCLKSGNACILRGGSEATHSNKAVHKALVLGLVEADLPAECVQYVPTTDRAAVGEMLSGLNGGIDLIIPRGGKSLVARVQAEARIPVLAHLEGRNHTFVDKNADLEMACQVSVNAKMRRPGICGATETLLLHDEASDMLPSLVKALQDAGCKVLGCPKSQRILPHLPLADEEAFQTEYLAPIINVKIVEGLNGALAHIAIYGSNHTDAIITQDADTAREFLAKVDSAIVMHNASTQFADGGEFGFGAEIGIATGRLHARGPVGAKHLTSYKYQVLGTGQVRPA